MAYLDFIKGTLKEAVKVANQNFGKVSGVTKSGDNNQVLTETDLAIGKFLVDQIKKNFPVYNIIEEETGVIDNKSDFTWVVDPIDGTSNFANGLPMYGIMIGLLEKDSPIAGGVAMPFLNEIYLAEKGKGAFCNGQKIEVTQEQDTLKCLATYALDGHQENPEITRKECRLLADFVLNIRNLRISNSCFDIMMVACGKYAAWLNQTSKIWDNVAPQIIIEEAGGLYTDFFGNKIDYANPTKKADKNFTVCAAPPHIHAKIQKLIISRN